MNFTSLIHTHQNSFLSLIKEKGIQIPKGHYSKIYSLKLSNQIVTFRFFNTNDNDDFIIIFSNPGASISRKNIHTKGEVIYFLDRRLNKWLEFNKGDALKAITSIKHLYHDQSTYLKFEHALSDSEKEALLLGKDLTVNFGLYTINNKKIDTVTKSITADYSYFLGSNSLVLKVDGKQKMNTSNILKKDQY